MAAFDRQESIHEDDAALGDNVLGDNALSDNALGDNTKIENLLLHFCKMHPHDFLGPLGLSDLDINLSDLDIIGAI